MAYAQRLKHPGAVVFPSGLDVMAGFWLAISPFAFAFRHPSGTVGIQAKAAIASNIIVGIAICGMAFVRCRTPSKNGRLSWLNLMLGIWVLISPWTLGFAKVHAAMINNVTLGVIVIILSGWSAIASASGERMITETIKREM